MSYVHDITRAMEAEVGQGGAEQSYYDLVLREVQKGVAQLRKHKIDNTLPLLNLPENTKALEEIEHVSAEITQTFKTMVVIGMGGSSRGGKALTALLETPYTKPSSTCVHFIDNIDPFTCDRLLQGIDAASTLFLIISKSGDTAETLAQALVMVDHVEKKLGAASVAKHFLTISMPGDNALRRLSAKHSIRTLDHDPLIGGRFSVLANVGLIPAKVAGVDVRAILEGAGEVVKDLLANDACEPAKGAALNYALMQREKTVSVIMPYCDRLDVFSAWYQQVWAESLGKNGKGTTSLRALGAFDQHSQLQLYLDGPADKFLTLILLKQKGKGAAIPSTPDPALSYLNRHTIGDLMEAEQQATVETLTNEGVPVRIFSIDTLDEKTMGALLMHFMIETILMAHLLGINAFDQPAVEESKRLAREALAKA